jgi:hypothetical protein
MPYFLFGLLVLGLLLLGSQWFTRANPRDVAQAARIATVAIGGLVGIGLLLAGRFGLAFLIMAGLWTAIRAIRRHRGGADPMQSGPAGDPVEIRTDLLQMRLDRATGEVDGAVRQGRFAGSELGDLGLGELLELLAEAGRTDPQSSSLLEAYLDRRFPDWREAAQEGPAAAGGAGMDEQQALDILGLQKGAGADAIKEAHRRLMTKVHPDSGGSNFLAAQINRAKDLLLGAARGHRD